VELRRSGQLQGSEQQTGDGDHHGAESQRKAVFEGTRVGAEFSAEFSHLLDPLL
jgi:hypothetical protein